MGAISEIDSIIAHAISPLPGTPEQMMEERIARLADEMTQIAALTMDPDQRPLIEREWRTISLIALRARLILSTINGEEVEATRRLINALDYAERPSGLRLIKNSGADR